MRGRVWLYDEPAAAALNVETLAEYLQEKLSGWDVEARGALGADVAIDDCARAWAAAKVRNVHRPTSRERSPYRSEREPLHGELAYERRRLTRSPSIHGLLYDGPTLQESFRAWLPSGERSLSDIHVIFTNQLIGTFDEDDRRYHVRVIVAGIPHLISTTGLVEAPAKPREYYLVQQQYQALGRGEAAEALLKEELAGRFLEHGDPRTTEVLKGYVLQAVFYQTTGEAFCDDPDCRLFNAHWQEEVLRAQRDEPYDLCPHHALPTVWG